MRTSMKYRKFSKRKSVWILFQKIGRTLILYKQSRKKKPQNFSKGKRNLEEAAYGNWIIDSFHQGEVGTRSKKQKKRKQVGILGGNFNPVHNAHLVVADQVRQQLCLDQVLLMPEYEPPHVDKINDWWEAPTENAGVGNWRHWRSGNWKPLSWREKD